MENSFQTFEAELQTTRDWLFDAALPLWADRGVDRRDGGFFERLTPQGEVIDDPRRTRLVARQIYAFATSATLGWNGPAAALVNHGLEFFTKKSLRPDGGVYSSVRSDGLVASADFDLYDHAFALFGLAAVAKAQPDRSELHEAMALSLLDHMEASFKHPQGGFEESSPRTLPLKANPHMHMLEATLAWQSAGQSLRWQILAREIVDLCLLRFINPETDALHEFLDGDWNLILSPPNDMVEPGHLFEWSWLLVRWGLMQDDEKALSAGRRMHDLAEAHGVCPDIGLAFNELDSSLNKRDGRFRLWPQTERLKAKVAQHRLNTSDVSRVRTLQDVADGLKNLRRYFDHPVKGSWWEHFDSDGIAQEEPARASSLYHVICAIAEADDLHQEIKSTSVTTPA